MPQNSAIQAVMPAQLPPGPTEKTVYSYGVRAGETLHISGLVAFDAEANIIGENDIAAQTEQVFQNMKAVVEEAGGSMQDIVSTTTYLVDREHASVVNAGRARYFTGAVLPTHTVIVVAGFARPQFLVEISAIAYLGN